MKAKTKIRRLLILLKRYLPRLRYYARRESAAFCGTCGHALEEVRPGKYQCNYCEVQNETRS